MEQTSLSQKPNTGLRNSRLNPKEECITKDVTHLGVVSGELRDAAKDCQNSIHSIASMTAMSLWCATGASYIYSVASPNARVTIVRTLDPPPDINGASVPPPSIWPASAQSQKADSLLYLGEFGFRSSRSHMPQ